MLFEETIERVTAQAASVQGLFGGDGNRIRENGAARIGESRDEYTRKLTEAAKFLGEIEKGRKPFHLLREAMTTSDFPILFADILDRQLLANYRETQPIWQNFARKSTVPDFRDVKRFAIDGAEGVLDPVDEREEYPEAALSETSDSYGVRKYGRRIDLSWETLINDDLDVFRSAPERLARGARRSEDKFATQMFVGTAGPHASLYNGGFGNIVPGNPALSLTSLQTALEHLATLSDTDGEPIESEYVYLVVPPALEITALNILNATQLQIGDITDATVPVLQTENWMRNRLRLLVGSYIPRVADTNGNTSWFLFSDPNDGRPAIEIGKLRGYEEPGLFERVPNARRIGGGEVMESFEDDSQAWKVRHVFGGGRLTNTGGAKATLASNGTGVGS